MNHPLPALDRVDLRELDRRWAALRVRWPGRGRNVLHAVAAPARWYIAPVGSRWLLLPRRFAVVVDGVRVDPRDGAVWFVTADTEGELHGVLQMPAQLMPAARTPTRDGARCGRSGARERPDRAPRTPDPEIAREAGNAEALCGPQAPGSDRQAQPESGSVSEGGSG